jgi:hypothetical protein
MLPRSYGSQDCSLARALAIVGERLLDFMKHRPPRAQTNGVVFQRPESNPPSTNESSTIRAGVCPIAVKQALR